ncbi:carboxypeptidase-like regulatory domain-containing protein [Rosistilla oblonga]|uniref:carboxypeptidase-like regulatory domain-containing protein n=1 Tax=Rosistilla oblonga TaxID=2527990 RepID=UPI003A969016
MLNKLASVFVVIVMLVAVGCGEGGAVIEGKVALEDGTPIPRGVVYLNGTAGSFRGKIQPDGTYRIENIADGSYQVAVTGALDGEPVAEEMQYDEAGNPIQSKASQPKSLIDSKYSSPPDSGLSITVPGDDFDLSLAKAK